MYKLFKRIIIGIGLTVMLFSLSNVEAKIHEEEVLVNITASLGNDNKNVELISGNRVYGLRFNVSFDDIDQDYNFLYWIIDGVIDFDKTESNLEFKATTNLNAVAVFVKDNQKAITFLDHSGSLIDTIYIEDNSNVVGAPNKPNKVGYESTEWISIYGSSNLNEIEESSVFKISYFKNTENIFLVDVEGGTTESRVVEYNDVVEVVATIDNFSHWEEYGKIVSFDETYIFSALYDRDLKAISGNEDVRSLITISHDIEIRDGYDSRLAQVYLSDTDELIEYGFIGIDNNNNETIYKSNNMNPSTNEYLGSFNENYNYSNIKAYIVVSNSNGIETIYSEDLMGVEEYTETFDNTKLTEKGNQYISDTFTGTNGVQWDLNGARREGDYPIDGVGIILRQEKDNGYIEGTFQNGLNSFSFNYRKAFTAAAARKYKVDVTHDGTTTTYDIPEFGSGSGEQTNIYEFSLNELNFTNEVIIKIYVVGTSDNQATFDNFKWTESSSSTVKPIERINVFFDLGYETNEKLTPLRIVKGAIPNEPSKPMREGYTFEYWLLVAEEFDFNTPIDKDITLVAKWKENKEYVSQRLLLIDFGNSGVSGYDSSSFTFTNESDGNTYTFNKTRAQLNQGNESYHDGMGVGLVMSPVSGKEISNIEIDLSNLEGLHKIEFKIASWHNSSFNKISGFNNATLNVYKKEGSDFVLMKDLNEKPALENLTKETYTSVSYELDGAGIYKIEYNAPSAASGNTTQALMVDDIGIFSLVEAGDNNLVTFDYNYEGSPSNKIVMVETGSTIDDYEPERLGYDFLGWYLNDEEYDFNSKVESNFTLKAKWKQSAIVVTFDYGYLDKEAYIELVDIGENVNAPSEPQREGYNFLGWIETDIGEDIHDNQVFPFRPTNNIRFIAKWNKIDKEPSDLDRDDNNLDDLYSSLEGKTGEELYNGLKDIISKEHDPRSEEHTSE